MKTNHCIRITLGPRIPKLYGLPKTHKVSIPPVILNIDSVLHKLVKAITKILTSFGTVSPSHVRNSWNLVIRPRGINMTDKLVTSLDIKSLYINISVNA